MYKLVDIDFSETGLNKICNLVNYASGNHALSVSYLRWLYLENPLGTVVGFNAILDDRLVAHYATIPVRAMIHGIVTTGLLSVNTATHPLHVGKGLFIKLAKKTYDLASERGFTYVVGVANDNSIHGFINKLDFQSLGRLETRFITGPINYFEKINSIDFVPINDSRNLIWRLSNPKSNYFILNKKQSTLIFGKSRNFQVVLYEGDKNLVPWIRSGLPIRNKINPIKMWLGLDSRIDWNRTLNVQVSDRFKATSLNLIFRDLKSWGRIDDEMLSFWGIDFDSY
jgi:hypothetical protein